MAQNQIRQNYHEECEAAVNNQINMELFASYTYLSMSYYFDRDEIGLPGFHTYFKKSSQHLDEHVHQLMKFQNQRGGRIVFKDIPKSPVEDWKSGLEAMKAALYLEKDINQEWLNMHKLATTHTDAQMAEFIKNNYLTSQVETIKQLGDYVTILKRVGNELGVHAFDKELASKEI